MCRCIYQCNAVRVQCACVAHHVPKLRVHVGHRTCYSRLLGCVLRVAGAVSVIYLRPTFSLYTLITKLIRSLKGVRRVITTRLKHILRRIYNIHTCINKHYRRYPKDAAKRRRGVWQKHSMLLSLLHKPKGPPRAPTIAQNAFDIVPSTPVQRLAKQTSRPHRTVSKTRQGTRGTVTKYFKGRKPFEGQGQRPRSRKRLP